MSAPPERAKPRARPPLATLTRGVTVVRLHERFGFTPDSPRAAVPDGASGKPDPEKAGPRLRRFVHLHDAEVFLRSWQGKSGAMSDLRYALGRVDPGATLSRFSNDDVIRVLAAALVSGAVLVTESSAPAASAQPLPMPVQQASAPPALAAPAVAVPLPPALVLDPIPESLVAALEDVQIAGAQVLPEVLQTMEQISLSMEKLNLATVSLAPTPTGVPAIGAALTAASDAVAAMLAAL